MKRRSGKTVLVVDDDEMIRDFVAQALPACGYRLLKAASGEEALQFMKEKEPIDLLLTDVVMPGMMGQELAAHFWAAYPEGRVLFMSAYLCPTVVHQGKPNSEKAFLLKPFLLDDLLRKMKKIFAVPGQ